MTQAPGVRAQSIRVALAATAVVAVAYAIISTAVIAFATIDLTNQIDGRLLGTFDRLPPSGSAPPPDIGNQPGRPFGPQVFVWTIAADGTVTKDSNTPDLPTELVGVTTPQTATIAGVQVRVAGTQVGSERIVVAQTLQPVSDTQNTILLGTLLIAPLLLVVVFVGAVIIGRRVAGPIEAARRRELEFTADASHELRTPLSVIEAHTSLALSQERDPAWYRTAFARVDRESRRMRRLLEDMLWLARFDAAQAPAQAELVDLVTVVRQAADRFAAIAETRKLDLAVEVPASAVMVSGGADLLDRLVGVLLDNACKYSPEGGRVEVHVVIDNSLPTLVVDDAGPGIAEGDREQIFDRFHRSLATTTQAEGAGLGLAIADAVTRATRGKWTIGRSPLGGARFSVRWPAAG
jgi:two-component system sensor histidine kinase CiaH